MKNSPQPIEKDYSQSFSGDKVKKHNKKWWHNKCWKLFSLKRRLEGSQANGYGRCITCGVVTHYKEANAGHYKHGVLDYDDMNINYQCVRCNKWLSGNLGEYARYLIKNYGQEEFEKLHIRASMAKKGENYSIEYLEQLATELTLKTTELLKEKNGL